MSIKGEMSVGVIFLASKHVCGRSRSSSSKKCVEGKGFRFSTYVRLIKLVSYFTRQSYSSLHDASSFVSEENRRRVKPESSCQRLNGIKWLLIYL